MTSAGSSLHQCQALDAALDAADPKTAHLRAKFAPGALNTLYFDANSIGPMPRSAPERMHRLLDEGWRIARRRSWNESDWLDKPRLLGDQLARVLGAQAGDLLVGDSTSVNQFKLLRYALQLAPKRTVVVAQREVFPSNRYVAEGVAKSGDVQLRLIDSITQLPAALALGDVAVVTLSHVDYRSSERLDMPATNARIRAAGAISLWDLSHSAGAIDVALRASEADLALGCGYKYLCGGPGAPSFVYVNPRHQQSAWPAICGWMGHADTFAFSPEFEPAADICRFQVGTPSVLANEAFACAAEIWQSVDPQQLNERHRSLSDGLIELVQRCELAQTLEITSPLEHQRRGGHVAFRFGDAQALSQALVAAGVVVSARKPDSLRFGIHPLTTRHADLWESVERMRAIVANGTWRDPKFSKAQV